MFARQARAKQSRPEAIGGSPRAASAKHVPDPAIGPVDHPLEHEAKRVAEQVLRAPARHPERAVAEKPAPAAPTTSGGGAALDPASRAYFEPRFGFDFSSVRIHADDRARESARSMGAVAFTEGSHIAFDGGRYQPRSNEGRRLLAHELTHVVQQGHASRAAGAMSAGVMLSPAAAAPAIQRQVPETGQVANQPDKPPAPAPATQQGTVSHPDFVAAFTSWLYQAQTLQGTQTLRLTDDVKLAVNKMFPMVVANRTKVDNLLRGPAPGNAPEFANAVADLLPNPIPRVLVAHVMGTTPKGASPDKAPKSVAEAMGHVFDDTVPPLLKKMPISEDLKKTLAQAAADSVAEGVLGLLDASMTNSQIPDQYKNALHKAVEGLIKNKKGDPDPRAATAGLPDTQTPPPPDPSRGSPPSAPGEHIFKSPPIKVDFFPTPDAPKPNLPKPARADDAQAVQAIIDSLDDNLFIPASVTDKDKRDNYSSAKAFARDVAVQLGDANKKKNFTVNITIAPAYRTADGLPEIYDKMTDVVKRIAAAIPGGVPNVGQVVITPGFDPQGKTMSLPKVVHLRSDG